MSGKYKELLEKNVNLNTFIAAAILTVTGWTLCTVNDLGKSQAVSTEKAKSQQLAIIDLGVRLAKCETDILNTRLDVARMQTERTVVTTTTVK